MVDYELKAAQVSSAEFLASPRLLADDFLAHQPADILITEHDDHRESELGDPAT